MIQRVQSIYLFFSSLSLWASLVYLLPTCLTVCSSPVLTKNFEITGVDMMPCEPGGEIVPSSFLIVVTVVLASMLLLIIFLHRNRKTQMVLSYSTLVLLFIYSGWLIKIWYTLNLSGASAHTEYSMRVFLPFVAIICLMLAIKSIKKDEALIRSADRLR